MWKIPNTKRVYYETKTKETGATVIKGVMEFNEEARL
jgi:hypothetical protein